MNPITIGLIFLVVLLVYLLYTFSRAVSLMQGITPLRSETTVDATKMAVASPSALYYDCWVFITESDMNDKLIFGREFNLVLNGKTLKLLRGELDSNNAYTLLGNITTNFPLNKWVFISINVNGKVIETYLNGKLVATIPLSVSLTSSKTAPLRVGGKLYTGSTSTINGYITKLRRLPKTMTSDFVWSKYLEGNGQFSGIMGSFFDYFGSYSAKIIMKKSNAKEQEIKLF